MAKYIMNSAVFRAVQHKSASLTCYTLFNCSTKTMLNLWLSKADKEDVKNKKMHIPQSGCSCRKSVYRDNVFYQSVEGLSRFPHDTAETALPSVFPYDTLRTPKKPSAATAWFVEHWEEVCKRLEGNIFWCGTSEAQQVNELSEFIQDDLEPLSEVQMIDRIETGCMLFSFYHVSNDIAGTNRSNIASEIWLVDKDDEHCAIVLCTADGKVYTTSLFVRDADRNWVEYEDSDVCKEAPESSDNKEDDHKSVVEFYSNVLAVQQRRNEVKAHGRVLHYGDVIRRGFDTYSYLFTMPVYYLE